MCLPLPGYGITGAGPDREFDSCTIITTTANDTMAPIHKRMPVIIEPEHYDQWLNEGGRELLIPYAGNMQCWPVSHKVNKPSNNSAELIQPAH